MMTIADVERRLAEISAETDYQTANGLATTLWFDVLIVIAGGAPNPADLALAALKTLLIMGRDWQALEP